MHIVETIAPILVLLVLGAALARWKFLGREFMADLNRLVFYVALPSLIFASVASAEEPVDRTATLVGIIFATTFLVTLVAWAVAAWILRIPKAAIGTFVQAAFRGNFLFVGLPVLVYSFADLPAAEIQQLTATIFLIITPTMALFNVLSVLALQGSQRRVGAESFALMARSIATNPLIIACLAGGIFMGFGLPVPLFVDRALDTLGAAAVPVALLCIGGSLQSIELRGNRRAIFVAAALKVAAAPLIAGAIASALGISGNDLRIVVVLSACPTAAAAYIMARQMKGDEALASGSLVLSTLASVPALVVALWLT